MTETCAGAIFNTACPRYDVEKRLLFPSLGLCMPGISMRITGGCEGKENHALPPGVVGDLEVSGAVVFKGYFNNPCDTEQSFTSDGWFKTGDRALINHDGCLILQGRTKNLLVVNGVKYDPFELESAIDEAPILGVTPSWTCCFSYFKLGGHTEEVVAIYVPTYNPDDINARAQTADAIGKITLSLTGCRPQILPLPQSLLKKTSLGKLSRSAMKEAFERGEYHVYEEENANKLAIYRISAREEPRDELESELLTIFIDSMNVAPSEFDVQTSILDLGISSIELIKLKRCIETNLKCMPIEEIPLITLMTNTTVRDLAMCLVSSQRLVVAYNPVVKLQTGGDKIPLWFVHPGVGEVMVFMNLGKYITDRPVYALRASGFNQGEMPFDSIEEIVQLYHGAIKKEQPEGPYAVAGYSYGGMLAFEIGKILESNGDQVKFIGSFNLPPHIKTRMSQVTWKMSVLDLCHFLQLISEDRAGELAKELQDVPDSSLITEVMVHINHNRLTELALSLAALTRWAQIGLNLHRIAVSYEPSSSVASMDVFFCDPITAVASSKKLWLEGFLLKWKDFTRAEPRFHEVLGSHYTMLSPENVFSFQKTLRMALEARGI
ncbi:acetyl-CoA synthetase-like protein [Penicillium cosmopolitanum]|uniref:Acetyl-CoA synthetase-like protein n=1 Tax=Penicillium cosmopolitanum TaxID=1131564 RepID=A0A9W9SJ63_9EURO|nr:acetyl-CoA synthetase-like protein [Penicillium cosmopolitanum]KAJ5378930.1 acetyl-CoA synthetase-like protein [Penicillium cosmopolitanum]